MLDFWFLLKYNVGNWLGEANENALKSCKNPSFEGGFLFFTL